VTLSYLETGVLYCEDNLRQLSRLPANCVDLMYLDPPFFSNRNYEVIWGDEAEVRSFEDRWEGGIQHYVDWMRKRVRELHRVLKPTGTLYLHCDWHASHYLKVMLDDLFGASNFRNEIVWCYSGGGIPRSDLPRKHDTILRYTKTKDYFYSPVYRSYSEGTLQRGRTQVKGKYFAEGLRAEGTPINDWWTDVPKITSPTDPEKLGYPTQKPEALLERILALSSREGDVVLDPFCGCGTTVAVAERMKRAWIGIDISPTAVSLMKRRLFKATNGRCNATAIGLPVTAEDLHDLRPFEFQNWVIQKFQGTNSPRKSGDLGIDGYSFMVQDPIQVKQSERVGRNVVDNFETAMQRAGRDKGYIVAFSFTRGAREEVARARWERKLDIQLVRVEDLLTAKPEDLTPLNLLPNGASVVDLPITHPSPANARPSVEELIASDRSVG
jgi:DNA modification methylase